MRKRRKPRVVWLPPDTNNRLGANPASAGFQAGAFDFFLDILGPSVTGDNTTGYVAINGDIPSPEFQPGGLATNSIADIYDSGYRLRRIVGKIYVSLFQALDVATGDVPQVLVTAGFIVLRVDAGGQPLSAATPGSYSPAAINGWPDPWIWRRSWMLSNFTTAVPLGLPLFPDTNTNAAGVLDGPHIDARTARRIGNEERLFLVANAMVAKTGGGGNAHVSITGEVRCVASVLQMAGNRRNASR